MESLRKGLSLILVVVFMISCFSFVSAKADDDDIVETVTATEPASTEPTTPVDDNPDGEQTTIAPETTEPSYSEIPTEVQTQITSATKTTAKKTTKKNNKKDH